MRLPTAPPFLKGRLMAEKTMKAKFEMSLWQRIKAASFVWWAIVVTGEIECADDRDNRIERDRMTVKELITILATCNEEAKLKIIQEEELECTEYWDEEKQKVTGKAIELYSEDLYSHEVYLLAINK